MGRTLVVLSIFTGTQSIPKNTNSMTIKLRYSLYSLNKKYLKFKKLKKNATLQMRIIPKKPTDKTHSCKHSGCMKRSLCSLMSWCPLNTRSFIPQIPLHASYRLMQQQEYLNTKSFLTEKPQYLNLHQMTLRKKFP
jgi:hypothetical protein